MDDTLIISSSPHVSANNSTRKIMLDVIIAMIPSVIAATVIFGYLVLVNCIVCAVACYGFEMLYEVLFNKKTAKESSAHDLSSIVTGIMLALNLPTYVSIWGWNIKSNDAIVFSFDMILVCLLGSLFAICIVKMLFGGIGKNFANPALAARIFLFLAFASAFKAVFATDVWGQNITTGATWLMTDRLAPITKSDLIDMFLGTRGSVAVGETSMIALALGYIYLCVRKVIDWRLPIIVIVATTLFCFVFDGLIENKLRGTELLYNTLAHIMSGGMVFGAIFMVTDYTTCPNTFLGKFIYAIGIGLITALIRVYGSYPEGVSFAILIMNIVTPLLDKYIIPRPFGYVKPKKKSTEAKKAEVK